MVDLFYAVLTIAVLFFVLLVSKEFLSRNKKQKFCVICIAVTITWIFLLVLYWTNIFENKIIIAILMGQTSLGIFYLLEKKVKNEFKLFRLPFLLTLIFLIYLILEGFGQGINTPLFLIALWIFFFLIYLFKAKSGMRAFFKKIVECCKKW